MKKTIKRVICLVLVAAFIFTLAGCAKMNYVTNGTITAIKEVKNGDWQKTDEEDTEEKDESVLETSFAAGTYGGVKFDSIEDVVNYYVKAYDTTKAEKAEFASTETSDKFTFYKFLGDEDLQVGNILVDGSENAMINKLVPGIVKGIFASGAYGLVPCNSRNPESDNNHKDGEKVDPSFDFITSYLKADDILDANVVDNKDGTITLTIQPKMADNAERGMDPQGRFFEVLGDVGSTIDQISALSWSEGTTAENCILRYKGGTGVITIDTKTNKVTTADYNMNVKVTVKHASIAVLKDKSASLDITYKNHFPASNEYLAKAIKAKPAQ